MSATAPKQLVVLEIAIEDCRDGSGESLAEVVITKNGKTIRTVKPENRLYNITVKDLDTGTYILKYKSIFGLDVSETVVAKKEGTYDVTLCVNKMDYSKEVYVPFIDQLKAGEKYSIRMESNGCFHGSTDTLTITRDMFGYQAHQGTSNKILSPADIATVRHFELELNYMNQGHCTTTDEYTITYGRRKPRSIRDGSCSWWGFRYLTEAIWSGPAK